MALQGAFAYNKNAWRSFQTWSSPKPLLTERGNEVKLCCVKTGFFREFTCMNRNGRYINNYATYELKLGDFKAEYKGQMELYLRWLDKYERCPGEEQPMGLILCAGKRDERIELLELDRSGIHVAEYLTELPSKKNLQEKLHSAIKRARKRLGDTFAKNDKQWSRKHVGLKEAFLKACQPLTEEQVYEVSKSNRLVNMFIDFAELRALNQ